MKIIYIFNGRLPTEKAHGIQIVKMCEAFVSEGLSVTLVYPFRKNDIRDNIFSYYSVKENFKIKKIWAPDFYWPGKLDKAAVGIKSFISAVFLSFYSLFAKADIIYSRDEMPLYFLSFFGGQTSKNLRGLTSRKLVFEAHRFSSKRKFFYRRFNKKGVKIVAISKAIKTDLVGSGYESDKILVAHDGVDLEEFDIDISKEEARKKVDLPLDAKIVMYTGHLFEWKGADTLLEAAKLITNYQLPITNPRILFVFVGGTDHDIKQFKEKAQGLNNVLILGHKPHKEIPVYLKTADILVLPNSASDKISSYTSPLKLFEYMASGRPIVASDLPSVREVLNEDNAVFVKSDDPDSLAEGIKKMLNRNELGNKIPQKAFEDVKNYTWAHRAQVISNFV